VVELDTISASDADGSGSSPDGYTISAHAKGAYKTPLSVSFSMKNKGIISPYFIWLCFTLRSFFKFPKTKGLFVAMIPSVGHSSICPQSAQVSDSFSLTQLCTGQNLSQKGVFAPAIRHPVQFIISGVIVTPLSFVHSAAVFSRKALSFVIVAIRASHFSQSSPQQPIN
jgi:hypothetical protein